MQILTIESSFIRQFIVSSYCRWGWWRSVMIACCCRIGNAWQLFARNRSLITRLYTCTAIMWLLKGNLLFLRWFFSYLVDVEVWLVIEFRSTRITSSRSFWFRLNWPVVLIVCCLDFELDSVLFEVDLLVLWLLDVVDELEELLLLLDDEFDEEDVSRLSEDESDLLFTL